jgi:hypothetical protein
VPAVPDWQQLCKKTIVESDIDKTASTACSLEQATSLFCPQRTILSSMYLSHLICLICLASTLASPSPSPSPSPPPALSGEQQQLPPTSSEEQPPLPPHLSTLYPTPYSPSSPTAPTSPTPPPARDVSPPLQYVSRNTLPLLAAREIRPTNRVLPFRQTPPSPPLPWETPRPTLVDHENHAVWEGASGGRSAQPPVPTAHSRFTNGDQQRPASPHSYRVESEEFWRDGLSEEQRFAAAVHGPRTEADQEWEDNVTSAEQEWNDEVDEAAYEGATA